MEVSTTARWFGIDVSKATFDIALSRPGQRKPPHQKLPRTFLGCQEGLAWVTDHLQPGEHPALVMEATGGYSREMATWFLKLQPNLRLVVAQPVRVHHFAKLRGRPNKTDAQDAIMLAEFGEQQRRPFFHQPMSPAYTQIRALTRERAALVKAAVALGNRNELPSESTLAQRVREQMLEYHHRAIAELEAATAQLIASTPELAQDCRRLQTVPGVGPVVAATIMGECGDLRDFPHPKALTAFAGVVPAIHDSGSSVHDPAHMTRLCIKASVS